MKHKILVEVEVEDTRLYRGCKLSSCIREIALENGLRIKSTASFKILNADMEIVTSDEYSIPVNSYPSLKGITTNE